MEALTAIGLVANVITFIDFGYEVVHTGREVHKAATGATKENDDIESLTIKLQGLMLDLESGKTEAAMTADELRLNGLVKECQSISSELLVLLDSLKAKKPNSTRHAIKASLTNFVRKARKESLESRLDKCSQQLHLQLSQTTRLETFTRLNEIQRSGKCQSAELQSLKIQVKALRKSTNAVSDGSQLESGVRTLLDRSEAALNAVIQGNLLAALRFEKMLHRDESIEEAHTTTFDWLLDDQADSEESRRKQHDDTNSNTSEETTWIDSEYICRDDMRCKARESFVCWLSNETGIFHISGKPGAGKSTLMKYIATNPRTKKHLKIWAGDKRLIMASFFFWRHGNEYQKSFHGLLRSLLYTILKESPDLIQKIFPKQWEMNQQGIPCQFETGHIKHAFNCLIQDKEVLTKHRFAFFIDGLDEFEGRDNHLVRSLLNWSSSSTSVKICVSSRELPLFQERFSDCPKFRLHELTHLDILVLIQDTLRNNEDIQATGKVGDYTTIEDAILWKAEGVFLWVTLVLKEVERGLVGGDSIQSLEKRIEYFPSEMEDLFYSIFDTMQKGHPKDLHRAAIILDIVLRRPSNLYDDLTLLEVSFLDEYEDDKDFVASLSARKFWPLSMDEIQKRIRRSRQQVYSSCRGFLTVISDDDVACEPFEADTIILSHRSLIEFLLRSDINAKIRYSRGDFDDFQFRCQSIVAQLETCAGVIPRESGSWTTRFCDSFYNHHNALIRYRVPSDKNTEMHLLTALRRLISFASKEAGQAMSSTRTFYLSDSWTNGHPENHKDGRVYVGRVKTYPKTSVSIQSMYFWGFYELWPLPENGTNDELRLGGYYALGLILMRLFRQEQEHTPGISPQRLIRCLAFCLGNGASPGELVFKYPGAFYPNNDIEMASSLTIWHFFIWHSIVSTSLEFSPELLFSLFLAYGASPFFWLRFDPSDSDEKFQGMISVTGLFGKEMDQAFEPIDIPMESSSLIDLARRNGWLLSLRDLIGYWFPQNAEKIQRLVDLNTNRMGDPSPEEKKTLVKEYGFDLDDWGTHNYDPPDQLFKSWKGCSWLVGREGSSNDGSSDTEDANPSGEDLDDSDIEGGYILNTRCFYYYYAGRTI